MSVGTVGGGEVVTEGGAGVEGSSVLVPTPTTVGCYTLAARSGHETSGNPMGLAGGHAP